MLERNRIHCLDVLEGLKKLGDDSVDMVFTSPPYWNLRDFGKEAESVWGGDSSCAHSWKNGAKRRWGDSAGTSCSRCGAWKGQLGLEPDVPLFLDHLLAIFDEIKRVLRPEGTCWINLGDTYGAKGPAQRYFPEGSSESAHSWEKCLLGVPERFMLGMMSRGWILRNKIVWHKPNNLPSPVHDRFSTSWEHVFLFAKSPKYHFDLDAVREPHKAASLRRAEGRWNGRRPAEAAWHGLKIGQMCHPLGRNPGDAVEVAGYVKASYTDAGDYWNIATQGFKGAHFAVFPEKLVERAVKTTPPAICRKCGKARERIVESRSSRKIPVGGKQEAKDWRVAGFAYRCSVEHAAVGWTNCGCNAGFRPALVFDPFMGSGTTAVVAKRLGRDHLGLERNPQYVRMAEERLKACPGSRSGTAGK